MDLCYEGKYAGGKEKKINGRSATASQLRDGEKGLKQKLLQIESAIQKYLIMESPRPCMYAAYILLTLNLTSVSEKLSGMLASIQLMAVCEELSGILESIQLMAVVEELFGMLASIQLMAVCEELSGILESIQLMAVVEELFGILASIQLRAVRSCLVC
jgi:hypothetical protein